jgi:hypothetical protein
VSGEEKDPVVHRAIEELQRLPAFDRHAIDNVVRAAAAARVAPAEPDPADLPRTRSIRVWSALGLATAAAVAGFVFGGLRSSTDAVVSPPRIGAAVPTVDTQLHRVSSRAAIVDNIPIAQEFVLEAAQANRVALVGDFNSWNPKANAMTRDAAGNWSTTVAIVPGRHVYGFMVNDSIFTLDPRAMKARDPDLGGDGSVRIVGRP